MTRHFKQGHVVTERQGLGLAGQQVAQHAGRVLFVLRFLGVDQPLALLHQLLVRLLLCLLVLDAMSTLGLYLAHAFLGLSNLCGQGIYLAG